MTYHWQDEAYVSREDMSGSLMPALWSGIYQIITDMKRSGAAMLLHNSDTQRSNQELHVTKI